MDISDLQVPYKMPPPPPTKWRQFKESLRPAARYFTVVALLTIVISVVSFRRFWINDIFHIVFLAGLLYDFTYDFVHKHVV